MSLEWIHEDNPRWDTGKAKIIGETPTGTFDPMPYEDGDSLPNDWWRVESDGQTVGYGWMDCNWGDAEMLLAVAPKHRSAGVGTFILDRLEEEASSRGLNYLFNVVRKTHPDRDLVVAWLEARRFEASHDDDRLMRRVKVG